MTHSPRLTLLAVLFSGLALCASSGARPGRDDPDRYAVSRVLLDRSHLEHADPEHARAELALLGARAVPQLFDALARSGVPVETTDERELWKPLEPWQTGAVEAALLERPRGELLAFLAGLGERDTSPSTRSTALRLAGAVAIRSDLSLLARLGEPAPEERASDLEVRAAFAAALDAVVAREPSVVGALARLFDEAHPCLLGGIVAALGRADTSEAFVALGSLLGAHPEADAVIVLELGRLGARVQAVHDERVLDRLRALLRHPDARLRAEAASALGKLGDCGAVEELVRSLADTAPGVRKQAHRGLRAITGAPLGSRADSWEAWLEEQHEWWRREAPRHLAGLESSSVLRVSQALAACAPRRLFRDDLAPAVARCLARDEPDVLRMACASLGHLGSPRTASRLVPLLQHSDAGVRLQAWKALGRLTGRAAGLDPALWEDLLR